MSNCVLESASVRKNKITLTDYDYLKDIKNRIFIATLDTQEIEVLEEILYSSLNTPIEKLARNVDLSKEDILPILTKLAKCNLFTLDESSIKVNKEMRKYFELEMQKFEEDFVPGMEFLQGLLRKVPIHVLPTWYSIPRTSNNIFHSIVEKNLATPQTFLRYVADLNFGEPILKEIIDDVFASEDLSIPSKEIMDKYNLTKEIFAEYMLHLEFSFVCCSIYKKVDGSWEEHVAPFHEWAQYLHFLRKTTPKTLPEEQVSPRRPEEFSFVMDVATTLKSAPINKQDPSSIPFDAEYLQQILEKLEMLQLVSSDGSTLIPTAAADKWLELSLADQSLYFYRHPRNYPIGPGFSKDICTEKALREAEKSIVRVLDKGWVLFEDFYPGILASLSEETTIALQKAGRNWKYALPQYTDEEKAFLHAVVMQWLFEAGIVQTGLFEGKECFLATSLGNTLFAR